MSDHERIHALPDWPLMSSAVLQQDAWSNEDRLSIEAVSERRGVSHEALCHMAEQRAYLYMQSKGFDFSLVPAFISAQVLADLAAHFIDGFIAGMGFQAAKVERDAR